MLCWMGRFGPRHPLVDPIQEEGKERGSTGPRHHFVRRRESAARIRQVPEEAGSSESPSLLS